MFLRSSPTTLSSVLFFVCIMSSFSDEVDEAPSRQYPQNIAPKLSRLPARPHQMGYISSCVRPHVDIDGDLVNRKRKHLFHNRLTVVVNLNREKTFKYSGERRESQSSGTTERCTRH